MKTKHLLPFLFMSSLFASCSEVYSPALFHHDIAYQPKPASFDSLKSATYVSAAFNGYPSSNLQDAITSGQINVSRGYVFENFNVAYGAFGAFGDYQNGSAANNINNQPVDFTDKYFAALGGRASANVFVHQDNTDFRVIGIEAAYSHEFGPYAAYRKFAATQSGFIVDPRTDLLTAGLTTEAIFHNNNNTVTHSIRGFLGTTFGYNPVNDQYINDTPQNRALRNLFVQASYFITFKRYFFTAEIGNQLFVRFGYRF